MVVMPSPAKYLEYTEASDFTTTYGQPLEVNLASFIFLRGLKNDATFELNTNVDVAVSTGLHHLSVQRKSSVRKSLRISAGTTQGRLYRLSKNVNKFRRRLFSVELVDEGLCDRVVGMVKILVASEVSSRLSFAKLVLKTDHWSLVLDCKLGFNAEREGMSKLGRTAMVDKERQSALDVDSFV